MQNFDQHRGKNLSYCLAAEIADQDLGNLACQKLAEILTEIWARSQNLGSQKFVKILNEILAEISARSLNLGSQKLTKNLGEIQVRSSRDSHGDIKILEVKLPRRELDISLALLPTYFTCKMPACRSR